MTPRKKQQPQRVSFSRLADMPRKQLQTFLGAVFAPYSLYRHEINNSLTCVYGLVEYIQLDVKNALGADENASKELQRALELLGTNLDHLVRVIEMSYIGQREETFDGLCTVAPSIVRELRTAHPTAQLKSNTRTLPKESILFPSNTVFAITNELLSNALSHSASTRVWLQWTADDKRMDIRVHDAGVGICEGLSAGYAPLDVAWPPETRAVRLSGLRHIGRLISICEGTLLVRRSKRLGGTECFVRLPHYGFAK